LTWGQMTDLGAGVREAQSAVRECEPQTLEVGIHRLLERTHVARTRKRIVALCLAGAAAAVLITTFVVRPAASLGFTVGSSSDVSFDNRWIWAQDAEPVPVRFTDGTTMELEPDTRARVGDVRRHEASLTLETGTVRARLASHDGQWAIAAGPYQIRGSGSEFDVAWDPEAEVLEVEVQRGAASVDGPYVSNEQVVTLAQRLTVALRKKQVTISSLKATGELAPAAEKVPAFELMEPTDERTSENDAAHPRTAISSEQ
jgi:transmembrane sensor